LSKFTTVNSASRAIYLPRLRSGSDVDNFSSSLINVAHLSAYYHHHHHHHRLLLLIIKLRIKLLLFGDDDDNNEEEEVKRTSERFWSILRRTALRSSALTKRRLILSSKTGSGFGNRELRLRSFDAIEFKRSSYLQTRCIGTTNKFVNDLSYFFVYPHHHHHHHYCQ
jgi:hypothetical protein